MFNIPNLTSWSNMALTVDNVIEVVDIVIIGKYTNLSDSYLSLSKSLLHSAIKLNVKVNIIWIESSDLEIETKESDLCYFLQYYFLNHLF